MSKDAAKDAAFIHLIAEMARNGIRVKSFAGGWIFNIENDELTDWLDDLKAWRDALPGGQHTNTINWGV